MPSKRNHHDKDYLAWIASLGCICCRIAGEKQTERTEVDHVGQRGIGQRSSDRETLPLCSSHHRTGKAARHRLGRAFWAQWGLDRDELIRTLNETYDKSESRIKA